MESLHPRIRGTRRASSGRFLRHQLPSTLTSSRSSPRKPTTTTRSRRRSPLPTSPAATVQGEAHENPALLHHFATAEQQKDAASLGMWVFLVTEIMFFGFANYLVPLMIGARDMAFPRLNAFSFWLSFLGGLLLYFSFLGGSGLYGAGNAPDVGWWSYAPLGARAFSPGH